MDSWTVTRIKALQTALGLSNQAFADKCGVSIRAVDNWRSGTNAPRNQGVRRRLDRIEAAANRNEVADGE